MSNSVIECRLVDGPSWKADDVVKIYDGHNARCDNPMFYMIQVNGVPASILKGLNNPNGEESPDYRRLLRPLRSSYPQSVQDGLSAREAELGPDTISLPGGLFIIGPAEAADVILVDQETGEEYRVGDLIS